MMFRVCWTPPPPTGRSSSFRKSASASQLSSLAPTSLLRLPTMRRRRRTSLLRTEKGAVHRTARQTSTSATDINTKQSRSEKHKTDDESGGTTAEEPETTVNADTPLLYRLMGKEAPLFEHLLRCHGFERTLGNDWNLLWVSAGVSSRHYDELRRHMKPLQTCNRFPALEGALQQHLVWSQRQTQLGHNDSLRIRTDMETNA